MGWDSPATQRANSDGKRRISIFSSADGNLSEGLKKSEFEKNKTASKGMGRFQRL